MIRFLKHTSTKLRPNWINCLDLTIVEERIKSASRFFSQNTCPYMFNEISLPSQTLTRVQFVPTKGNIKHKISGFPIDFYIILKLTWYYTSSVHFKALCSIKRDYRQSVTWLTTHRQHLKSEKWGSTDPRSGVKRLKIDYLLTYIYSKSWLSKLFIRQYKFMRLLLLNDPKMAVAILW